MFKTLFNIVLVVVGLGASVHASDFQLLHSDLEHSIVLDTSDEVHKLSTSHRLFFDLQSGDFSKISNPDTQPSQPDEIPIDTDGLCNRSTYLSHVQRAQFIRAKHGGFNIFCLKKTLFPFHSFW